MMTKKLSFMSPFGPKLKASLFNGANEIGRNKENDDKNDKMRGWGKPSFDTTKDNKKA
jgi:hypothetical protein